MSERAPSNHKLLEFDDGSHIELSSFSGGADEAGLLGKLTLVRIYPDGRSGFFHYLRHHDDFAPLLEDEPPAEPNFAKELEGLLNRFSRENVSNTPDFVLAEFIQASLAAFELGVNRRADWYNRKDYPGQPKMVTAPAMPGELTRNEDNPITAEQLADDPPAPTPRKVMIYRPMEHSFTLHPFSRLQADDLFFLVDKDGYPASILYIADHGAHDGRISVRAAQIMPAPRITSHDVFAIDPEE